MSKMRDDIPGFSRRTVLESAAVAAVGAGAFAGVASATNPNQINFCGCSQVCVEREGPDEEKGGTFDVILAHEDDSDDGWEFEFVEQPDEDDDPDRKPSKSDFCYEIEEDSDWKVIAVQRHTDKEDKRCKQARDGLYCNPMRCTQDAVEAYITYITGGDGTCGGDEPVTCVNDGFGTFDDPLDGKVTIVQGRCGEAGRAPPGREQGR